ncbi:MAG TPA: biotin/lipoyl-containing protein [Opitutaceae bacterium]|nr:biotin/lipoyl-containing protein [Opitutaceae bacterium]
MPTFRAMLKVPAVVANQHALTLVSLEVGRGTRVKTGQKLATLEGDKASIDFESPTDGTVREIRGKPGDTLRVNAPFIAIETFDPRLRHLEVAEAPTQSVTPSAPAKQSTPPANWTPRALKLAAQAGLNPSTLADIEPTGPGGRVSGDDVTRHLAARKA